MITEHHVESFSRFGNFTSSLIIGKLQAPHFIHYGPKSLTFVLAEPAETQIPLMSVAERFLGLSSWSLIFAKKSSGI